MRRSMEWLRRDKEGCGVQCIRGVAKDAKAGNKGGWELENFGCRTAKRDAEAALLQYQTFKFQYAPHMPQRRLCDMIGP